MISGKEVKSYELMNLPQMAQMADVLKAHIIKQKLYTNIQGKNYAHVEGWQFGGGMAGLLPRVVKVENLSNDKEIKWLTEVEIVRAKDGEVISRGYGICSDKEGKKKNSDEYVIISMSQTRAIGKAYRNVIGWVMKLAGYEGAPAEEMPVEKQKEVPLANGTTEYAGYCQECTKEGEETPLTQQIIDYSKRAFGKPICSAHQKTETKVKTNG